MDINKQDSLKFIIQEQHRDYDYLLRIYERAGAKENVLLTATFGIVAYLYYIAPTQGKLSIVQRLSIPSQDYGKVIYIMAAAFFVAALLKLVLNVFGNNLWMTAYETDKNDYTYKQTETLEYTKGRYDKCHEYNLKSYMKRKTDLSLCFYTILISATILIVIKTLK